MKLFEMMRRHQKSISNIPSPQETMEEDYWTYISQFDFSATKQPTSTYDNPEVENGPKKFYECLHGHLKDPASTSVEHKTIVSYKVQTTLSISSSNSSSSKADKSLCNKRAVWKGKTYFWQSRHNSSNNWVNTKKVTGLKRKSEANYYDIDCKQEFKKTVADKKVYKTKKSEIFRRWAMDCDTDIEQQIELTKNSSNVEENVVDGDNSQRLSKSAYMERNEAFLSSRRALTTSSTTANTNGMKYEPSYHSYQLLGDGQIVRFAGYVLHMEEQDWRQKIQYCVSGQMINGLKDRLLDGSFPLHDQVIVLIGTNDMLNNTSYEAMERSYNSVLDHLKSRCSKIVLLTVPPVAKLEDDQLHWQRLRNFNEFILKKADEKVSVVDLAPLFMQDNNKCNHSLYEIRFNRSGRIFNGHLSKDGLNLLQRTLDEMYFRHQ